MNKTTLTALFALIPCAAMAQPYGPPYEPIFRIQVVTDGARSPRALFRLARQPYRYWGMDLKITKIVKRRLPKSRFNPDMEMLRQFAKYYVLSSKERKTLVLPRVARSAPLGGLAGLCDQFAIATWSSDLLKSAWLMAHEIGHMVGADHLEGNNLMNPIIVEKYRKFKPASVWEILKCYDKEQLEKAGIFRDE